MPQVQVYVSLPLPVDEVFRFLADGRNLPRWHSGVTEIRGTDPFAASSGTGCVYRYRFPGRHRDFRLECCTFEPDCRIGYLGQRMWTPLGSQVPRYDFRLWPQGAGCRVGVQVTSWLTGGMLALWPVVALGWRRDLPDDAQRLFAVLTGSDDRADVGFDPGPGVIGPQPRRRFRLPATR
ncbi:SRPBCC family protein [Streptomyces sp. TRM 70351]|uniref:SRPBCC family protein n=1 Tax=Streptomyces sp. TRM 70351 TaxID=3116552 RepID=UPI002E7C1F3F|nr:SRPBCC family protein [Streptomyces sp. TRM 70351]MEE1930345.1 SRPBCC family protein [Streptomyces sp. TRM 70351]